MLNRQEVIYNSKSLAETWLDKKSGINSLWVELNGSDDKEIVSCKRANCGETIGELLYSNHGRYKQLKLCGDTNKGVEVFGALDII